MQTRVKLTLVSVIFQGRMISVFVPAHYNHKDKAIVSGRQVMDLAGKAGAVHGNTITVG
jgi:uncharacterized Zn-binding protein involved in type VI secretion